MGLYSLIPPRDPDLMGLIENAVIEGRSKVIAAKKAGKHIRSYWNWPTISWMKSGFPSIGSAPLIGPTDYAAAFSSEKEGLLAGPILYSEVAAFQDLIEYVRGNETIRARLLPPRSKDDPLTPGLESLLDIGAVDLATAIIDRTIHLLGEDELDAKYFRQYYLELEAPLFAERLGIEILVPVALTKFEAHGRVRIADAVFLEEMDEPTHQARYPQSSSWLPANGMVIGAATHALVLTNYQMAVINRWRRDVSQLSFYPIDVIDRFFAALRLVTGVDTGYGQIVLRPVGWAESYKGTLPPLFPGPSIHAYPESFDRYGWLDESRHVVTEAEVENVASTFSQLLDAPSAIALATRRLNSAMLRDDEADSIIDLCIGLEALLTDETRTEMTHKLALRVAAVCSLAGSDAPYSSSDVFKAVKRIYTYRSKLVHGGSGAGSSGTIASMTPPMDQAPVLAADLLRRVVRLLIHHPEYLDASKVDVDLIASRMDHLGTSVEEAENDEL